MAMPRQLRLLGAPDTELKLDPALDEYSNPPKYMLADNMEPFAFEAAPAKFFDA
jgi:hypothetical protein